MALYMLKDNWLQIVFSLIICAFIQSGIIYIFEKKYFIQNGIGYKVLLFKEMKAVTISMLIYITISLVLMNMYTYNYFFPVFIVLAVYLIFETRVYRKNGIEENEVIISSLIAKIPVLTLFIYYTSLR